MQSNSSEAKPLWRHQITGLERAKPLDEFAFFWEMGTGKSREQIELLRFHYSQSRRIMRTLILAPLIVVPNWRKEILAYSKIDPARVVLLDGTKQQRAKAWARAKAKFGSDFVAIVNYDKLVDNRLVGTRKVNQSEVLAWLREWGPEILILDESHRCKDIGAGRTKAVLQLSSRATNPHIRKKYILSGTPILKNPIDLFSQFLILDDGATLGKEFWPFKLKYMEDKNAKWKGKSHYFPKWVLRDHAQQDIHKMIQAKMMRVLKEECMDLPPLVRERRYVGMAPEQARVYNEMKRDFIAFMNNKASTASLALTKAQRLMQIASGYFQAEDGTKVKLKDTPKQGALRELLEELTPDHKVLVWAVYRENYEQIRSVCDELKISYTEIHGEITKKGARQEAEDRLQNDPACRVLIGHPGSGGIGINLVAASYSIFYSRSFSLDESQQAEARNHRGGSEIHERITRIDLICENTIEELVVERVDEKDVTAEGTLSRLAEQLQAQEF